MVTPPRPEALEVRPRHIPDGLKAVAGWVMWRWWWDGNRWTKPPRNIDGVKIDHTNPENWVDYSTAIQAYQRERGKFDGIGFSLGAMDSLGGVDLDHCVQGGKIEGWASEIIEELGGYAEISPSGTGVRVFGLTPRMVEGKKKDNIEMYVDGRYLTVTGHKLDNSAPDLVDFSEAFGRVYDRIFPDSPEQEQEDFERGEVGEDLAERFQAFMDDDPIFREKFNTPASVGDRSGHEFHLCAKLREEGFTFDEIWQLMDSSPQTKWRSREDAYKERTIRKAISAARSSEKDRWERETTSKRAPPTRDRTKTGDLFRLSSDDVLKTTKRDGENKPIEWKFSPAKAAASFMRVIPLKMASWDPKTIWWCDLGIWRPDGDRLIEGLCDDLGDEHSNGYQASEVRRRLRVKLGWDRVDFDVADPYLIATKNGFTIDLRTGEARETSPDDLISMPINANYDPAARCPAFIEFLKGSCGNDTDRLTLCDHLAACAIAMEIEYILFLLGHGSNGKKVYAKFMLDLFGVGAGEAIGLEELTKSRFAVAFLMRARFCIGTEQNPSGVQTEMMKRISGGDWISADIKNVHERARFRPFTQLMYDTNGMPVIEDNSAGWQRRFVGVNMPFKFVDDPSLGDPLQKKADRRLGEKLASEEEKSGVLNLLIERARVVCENFQITRRENDTVAYNKQAFSVRDFIDQFIEFYPDHRDEYQEPGDLLFTRFEEYARYTVGATVTRQKFSTILGKANGRVSEKITVDKMDVRGFKGLRFNKTAFDEFIKRIKGEYSGTTENDLERPENDLKTDSSIDIRTTRTSYSIFYHIERKYGAVGGSCGDENDLTDEMKQSRSTRSPRSRESEDIDSGKNKVVLGRGEGRSQDENEENEVVTDETGEGDDRQTITEELEEAERREAEYREHVRTPEPKDDEGRDPTSEESEALEVARSLQAAGKRVTFGNVEVHLNKAEGYVETSKVWGILRALGALGWTTGKDGALSEGVV